MQIMQELKQKLKNGEKVSVFPDYDAYTDFKLFGVEAAEYIRFDLSSGDFYKGKIMESFFGGNEETVETLISLEKVQEILELQVKIMNDEEVKKRTALSFLNN